MCDVEVVLPLLLALSTASYGQTEATLLEGESLLAGCLDDPGCNDSLIGLVSENMAEYGFVQQADPIAISALGGKGMGLVAEARLDTVTLGERNELEKLVIIPPALPRLAIGYQYGSYTYDTPYPQLAAGVTVLPPFRLFGGTLWGMQVDTSTAVPLGTHVVWAGVEAAYGYGQLAVPLLGTRKQLKQIETFAPWVQGAGGSCADIGEGCLDQFRQHSVHGRVGISVEPVPAVFTYSRLAFVGIVQRLEVAYDETLWGSGGLQIQGQFGAGIRAGDRYQLAMGGVIASRPPELSTTDARSMGKIVATTSFRFGKARYWEKDLPPEEAD